MTLWNIVGGRLQGLAVGRLGFLALGRARSSRLVCGGVLKHYVDRQAALSASFDRLPGAQQLFCFLFCAVRVLGCP